MTTKSTFPILITDRFDSEAMALLQGEGSVRVAVSTQPNPTAAELHDARGLIIRSRTKVDAHLLDLAPNLNVIVTATSGFDHIDLSATRARGICVMHTPEANAPSAAELTWALVLACARRIPEAHRAVKVGEWRREQLMGRQLANRIYGIVGLGRIGSRVARIAQAFGMKTIAYDPYKDDSNFFDLQTQRVSFEELLKLADVMSFHVPATSETQGMLHATALEHANHGLIFVNTSRGSIISESDLVQALEQGWIGAAGLDVFEKEPLPQHSPLALWATNSAKSVLVLSPHLGATTTEAFAQASREAAEKILAFATTGAISDPLPPAEPWFDASE